MSTITRPRMMRLFLRLPIQSGHNSSTQSSRLVKKLLCRGPGVPGDPGPRPPLIVAGQYLLSRPPAQIDREADVVEGDETMPQQLIFPHQMRQVSPAVPRAGLARAFRIERSEVPAIPGVPEVDAASGGQHSPVAGEAGREHAVEHVHPKAYDLEYPDRVPDAHKVPGLVGGEHGRGQGEGFKHLLPRFSDRETTDGVTREAYLDCAGQALLPCASLHRPAQRAVRLRVCSWYSRPASAGGHSSRTIAISAPSSSCTFVTSSGVKV